MNIVQLIASLSILVFVHELGHFFFARLFGTRVEKFYLFFNPWFSLFKWQSKRSGTIYGLGWLPLGGYCQIAGMVDESMDTEQLASAPKPDEFRSKKTWQRLLIMAGGIIFNLILAFFIYVSVAFVWGDKRLEPSRVQVGWEFSETMHGVGFVDGDIITAIDGDRGFNALDASVVERLVNASEVSVLRGAEERTISIPSDMMQRVLRDGKGVASLRIPFIIEELNNAALREAGVRPGDEVIGVAGKSTASMRQVMEALAEHAGQTIELQLRRDSLRLSVALSEDGKLGVMLRSPEKIFEMEQVDYSLLEAVPAGASKAKQTIVSYVEGLRHIFTKEGAQSLGGLGTMAKLFPAGFSWQAFWMTTAFLSIILAVMNLLPIPALDGGHIVFILIEMLTGRKLSDQVMGYIQMTGMILLLLLMLYANGNDIYRYLIKG